MGCKVFAKNVIKIEKSKKILKTVENRLYFPLVTYYIYEKAYIKSKF